MGFSMEDAKEALEKCSGNVELAIEHLTSNLGRAEYEPVDPASKIRLGNALLIKSGNTTFFLLC